MARPESPVSPFPGRVSPRSRLRARWMRLRFTKPWRFLLPWLPLLLVTVVIILRHEAGQYPDLPTAEAVREGPVWHADTLTGRPLVVDGDTLRLGRTRLRLDGIDAPETGQTCQGANGPWRCGAAATKHLWLLTGGQTVICEKTGTDGYGRTLARCRIGGADIGSEMVRAGLAMAYRRYSLRYLSEELAARAARRGIWATEFTAPWEWRRAGADRRTSEG